MVSIKKRSRERLTLLKILTACEPQSLVIYIFSEPFMCGKYLQFQLSPIPETGFWGHQVKKLSSGVEESAIEEWLLQEPLYSDGEYKSTLEQYPFRVHKTPLICWVGDVNIDMISSPLANSYINFCDSKGIKFQNWKPTRDKACLDHSLNLGTSINSVKILSSTISDHNMILFKIGKNSSTKLVFTKVKSMSDHILSSCISTPMSFFTLN